MAVSDTSVSVAPEVLQFLSQPRPMLINGQWVQATSGKHFPVYNPATGEVMARVAEGDKEDINRAVQAARHAFDSGPWHTTMTPSTRSRLKMWKRWQYWLLWSSLYHHMRSISSSRAQAPREATTSEQAFLAT